MVEWLTPSTAVRKVAGSNPAEDMFSEKIISGLSFPMFSWIPGSPDRQTRPDWQNQIQSVGATIKGCPCILEHQEHVKDLTIKMAMSTMVTPTTSIAYLVRGVTAQTNTNKT